MTIAVSVSNKAPGINQGRLREDWLQSKDFAGFSQSGRLVSNKRLVLTRRGCESERFGAVL